MAADLGRRYQSETLIDVSCHVRSASLHDCYCQGFGHHDGKGGTVPDPLVWDQVSYLVVLVGSCHVVLVLTCPG